MYRDGVREDLLARRERDGYVYPDYDGYSFHRVVPTALSALDAAVGPTLPGDVFDGVETDVDRVLFVLLDGFGDSLWREHAPDHVFLRRLGERGTVTPLTSVFPSETAAAIPSMHAATTAARHGAIGWFQWLEEVDGMVQTLPFTTPDGEPADEAHGADWSMVMDVEPVYGAAAEQGVATVQLQPDSIVPSDDEDDASADHETVGYEDVAGMAATVRRRLSTATGPTFIECYVPNVDSAAHESGVASPAVETQVRTVTECLRRELVDGLDPAVADRTLVVLTADHGLLDTDPATNVDLSALDGVWEHRRLDRGGEPIPPAGSGRNVHLFLAEGTVPAVRDAVERQVDAVTFTREEAIETGLFGPEASERFRRRCGDLVVVPRRKTLWHEADERAYVGMHGGLSREEMLVPFATARLSALQG